MSDVIQLLPDSVANQIAAGEVIQRPASVVKELVENALDAGATEVHVSVVDAGRTTIQVIDDGKGMSPTDARLSFERHATSKIRKAEDLFDLHTMGFRGEALASIAAVAQVELKTRMHADDVGTAITIHGSRFVSQEPVSCPVGSNFKVENLFFNVPARRKFLKSNTTELNNILTTYERIVLVNPQVAFTLHSNGVQLSNLSRTGQRQRILDVFGKKTNQDLLPIAVDTSVCRISGFVGKPESARKKETHQFFFVNGRFMKHPYFSKAVMTPFERLVPQGEQVPYFIYFDVPASDIDVNIHPTKTEIKFENEQVIWQILSAAVKEAVGKFNDIPSIDFDVLGKPDIPVYNPDNTSVRKPEVRTNPQYNPFNNPENRRATSLPQWEDLYQGARHDEGQQTRLFDDNDDMGSPAEIIAEKSPSHYQYKGRLIMTAVKSGLMLIDQHRAHLRILFEEYLEKMRNHKWHSQGMLFPEIIKLSLADGEVMRQILPELSELGFSLTDLGGGSFSVDGIPAGIEGLDATTMLPHLLEIAKENTGRPKDEIDTALALALAKASAIPQGQVLGNDEMESLVNRLFTCSNVNLTPDGSPILCILPQEEIDRLMG
ncbi:MAG: DNA mismatch repair endonuclease MutL [Prevotella sp.]|nr:DNA mismatch repair endonuclease MutL [Prevotella sp.]MBR3088838.1 DNA mismatch repair endonuclease MutL [Prevotella sp.]